MRLRILKSASVIFLCILPLVLINCEKEHLNADHQTDNLNQNGPYKMEWTTIHKLPKVANFMSSQSKESTIIYENDVVLATDSIGNTKYSVMFYYPDSPLNVFYNLILPVDSDEQTQQPYIIRYDCNDMRTFGENNFDFYHFPGDISVHPHDDYFSEASRTDDDPPVEGCEEHDEYGDPVACYYISNPGGGGGDGSDPTDPPASDNPGLEGTNYTVRASWIPCSCHDNHGCGGCCHPVLEIEIYTFRTMIPECPECTVWPTGGVPVNPSRPAAKLDYALGGLPNSHLAYINDHPVVTGTLIDLLVANDNSPLSKEVAKAVIAILDIDESLGLDEAIEVLIPADEEVEGFFASQIIVAPELPIDNIEEYLECFDISAGAELTIYVNQPTANNDRAYSVTGGVGHAFIGITQNDITRVFGLYPISSSTPFNPDDPHAFGNNQGDDYDVSVSINISAFQLSAIITESVTYDTNYNLSTNNCTNFVMDIAQLTDLPPIPDTHGEWPGGSGNNPGAFGEDLREIMEEFPGAIINEDGGNAPLNGGNCD